MSWTRAGGFVLAATKFLLVLPPPWDGVGSRVPWAELCPRLQPCSPGGSSSPQCPPSSRCHGGTGTGQPTRRRGRGLSRDPHGVGLETARGLRGVLEVPAPGSTPSLRSAGARGPRPTGPGQCTQLCGDVAVPGPPQVLWDTVHRETGGGPCMEHGKRGRPPSPKKSPGGGEPTAAGDLVQRSLWQLTAGVRGAQSCGEQSPAGSVVPVTTQHPAGPRVGPGCRPWHRGSSLRWPGQGWGRGTSTRRRARPDQRRTVPVAAHPEHDRGSPRGPGPAWAAVAGLGPVARLWMRLQCPEQWPLKASPWPAGTNVQHVDVCLGHPPLERHGGAVGGARGLVTGGQRHGHKWCWSCIQGAAAGCCRPAAGQSGPGSGSSPGSSRRGAAGPGRCPVIVLGGIRRAGRGWPQECGGSTGAGAAEPAHAQAPIGARR